MIQEDPILVPLGGAKMPQLILKLPNQQTETCMDRAGHEVKNVTHIYLYLSQRTRNSTEI